MGLGYQGRVVHFRAIGGSVGVIPAAEEAFEHFGAGGPGFEDRADGNRWRRSGEAGAGRIHGDCVFQAKDGLLVEGSLVPLGLGLQRPMEMRRDVLQGESDGV